MGLCKCPRKKVTNLFCFEHRVNVCDFCLTEDHPKCVVQSYLSWLSDSDYDANCLFCSRPLNDPSLECIRLQCLHLFHFECLNRWAEKYPANTAPAGYVCPSCKEPLFPKPNQASPIENTLRSKLQEANWARAALGLSFTNYSSEINNGEKSENVYADTTDIPVGELDNLPASVRKSVAANNHSSSSASEINAFINQLQNQQMQHKHGSSLDTDNADVKYKRRSAFEWFDRWLKSKRISIPKRTVQPWTCRRMFFYVLLFVIGILTLVTILSRSSRFGTTSMDDDENDPLFDPNANPHIRNVPVVEDKLE